MFQFYLLNNISVLMTEINRNKNGCACSCGDQDLQFNQKAVA